MMVPLSEIIGIGLELNVKEDNLKDCLNCFLPFVFKIYQDKHYLHIRQRFPSANCKLGSVGFSCKNQNLHRLAKNILRWGIAAAAAKSLQSCLTLCDPAAYQAPPSLGFSRQEHWSGLPFPSPKHESEK